MCTFRLANSSRIRYRREADDDGRCRTLLLDSRMLALSRVRKLFVAGPRMVWHGGTRTFFFDDVVAFLLPASGPELFIFENTICLTIVEDPQSPW